MYKMDTKRHEIGWVKRHSMIDNLLNILVTILILVIAIYTMLTEWTFERMSLDTFIY